MSAAAVVPTGLLRAGQLVQEHIGRHVYLGPTRPFAEGTLVGLDRQGKKITLRIASWIGADVAPVLSPGCEVEVR